MKFSLRPVNVSSTSILAGDQGWVDLSRHLRLAATKRKVIILADHNSATHCLPFLYEYIPALMGAQLLEIAPGETAKTLANAAILWEELLRSKADRDSLMICLGGGVVTDLGGFVAAGFQRGIEVIHIPTTLLGMVDAAIGGKTAVNLNSTKNQIGHFYHPTRVLIHAGFLRTLPKVHLESGSVEMAKNIILGDPVTWKKLKGLGPGRLVHDLLSDSAWKKWIIPAVRAKVNIVNADPQEKKKRKALNFGHTVGHALESLMISQEREPLLHGVAVAAGMACAARISTARAGLSDEDLIDILVFLKTNAPGVTFTDNDIHDLLGFIKSDKKGSGGVAMFSLLREPGCPKVNVACTREEIVETLRWYQQHFLSGS